MAAPKSRFSRSSSSSSSYSSYTNLSPPPPPPPDSSSEKIIEGAGSWDAIEWTKEEPSPIPIPHGMSDFLMEAEDIKVPGYGVVLVNTDEAGTLLVTNFRLLFVSEGARRIIALGTIPLATIEKFSKLVVKIPSTSRPPDKSRSRRLLQIIGIKKNFELGTEI